jgi:oxygen-independent coproporphyrinogen-3 oxidase
MGRQRPRIDNVPMPGALEFDAALIRKYDVRGPRYTSYPTAAQFSPAFTADTYGRHAASSAARGPLSLYVHIPFCRTICFYCACNKTVTGNYSRARDYVRSVAREAAMAGAYWGDRAVMQLHLGGGTPTYLRQDELADLIGELRRHFNLCKTEQREFSIEIDPRTVTADSIGLLAALGFNRLSLGVQDFDPRVQRAVNRLQSLEQTSEILAAARQCGFRSTNLDLIYGLPLQTESSFERTLEKVITLHPERLAIYAYAHLPALFKAQRQIDPGELPDADARLRLLELAVRTLTAAGYLYIGMDHFARPEDGLAQAQRSGTLQRNFQGYSTHARCDLVGLGVSAISDLRTAYSQNAKSLAEYSQRVSQGRLPVTLGVELTAEDLLRRDVIQSLMCRGCIEIDDLETRHGIQFAEHFGAELRAMQTLIDDELVIRSERSIEVTPRGRLLVRNVALLFDAYAPASAPGRFSRAI